MDGSSLYQILREILSKIFLLPIGLLLLALKYFKLENHTISGQLITWEDVMEQEFVSALKRFQNMLSFKKKTVFVSTITSLQDWPVNSNLDLALEVLQPIKVFFSFAD